MCDKHSYNNKKEQKSQSIKRPNKDAAERLIARKLSTGLGQKSRIEKYKKLNLLNSKKLKTVSLMMSVNPEKPQCFDDIPALAKAIKVKKLNPNVVRDLIDKGIFNVEGFDKNEIIDKLNAYWASQAKPSGQS